MSTQTPGAEGEKASESAHGTLALHDEIERLRGLNASLEQALDAAKAAHFAAQLQHEDRARLVEQLRGMLATEHARRCARTGSLAAAKQEIARLRAWMKAKAAYYAKDARELGAESVRMRKRGDEADAMFRFGCADYAAGFARELHTARTPPALASDKPTRHPETEK